MSSAETTSDSGPSTIANRKPPRKEAAFVNLEVESQTTKSRGSICQCCPFATGIVKTQKKKVKMSRGMMQSLLGDGDKPKAAAKCRRLREGQDHATLEKCVLPFKVGGQISRRGSPTLCATKSPSGPPPLSMTRPETASSGRFRLLTAYS